MSRRELSCRKQSTPRLCCYFEFSIYHPKDPETSNVRTLQTWRCLRPKFKFQQTNMKLWQQPKFYFKLDTARNYVLCAPQTATGGKTRERAAGVSIYTNSYIGDDRVLRFGHALRENTFESNGSKTQWKESFKRFRNAGDRDGRINAVQSIGTPVILSGVSDFESPSVLLEPRTLTSMALGIDPRIRKQF